MLDRQMRLCVIYFTFNLETLWYQAPDNKNNFLFRGVVMAFGAWLSAAKLAANQKLQPSSARHSSRRICLARL